MRTLLQPHRSKARGESDSPVRLGSATGFFAPVITVRELPPVNLWSEQTWGCFNQRSKDRAKLVLQELKNENITIEYLADGARLALSSNVILEFYEEKLLALSDISKMTSKVSKVFDKIEPKPAEHLKLFLKTHPWHTWNEVAKRVLCLPGVFWSINKFRQPEHDCVTTSWTDRMIDEGQIVLLSKLSPAQIEFLERPELITYITDYRRLVLALRLSVEMVQQFPENWWQEYPGVIDLVAQGHDPEKFKGLSDTILKSFNVEVYADLLKEWSLGDFCKIPPELVGFCSESSKLIKSQTVLEMLKTMSVERVIRIFNSCVLVSMLGSGHVSLEQVRAMSDDDLKVWIKYSYPMKKIFHELKETENCFDAIFKSLLTGLDQDNVEFHETFWRKIGRYSVFTDVREKLYQYVKACYFAKQEVYFSVINNAGYGDFLLRIRRAEVDIISSYIMKASWDSFQLDSKMELVEEANFKAMPLRVANIWRKLALVKNPATTEKQVSEIFTELHREARRISFETFPEALHGLFQVVMSSERLCEVVNERRRYLTVSAQKARTVISQAKSEKISDACFILACACYCPFQWSLTILNCFGHPDCNKLSECGTAELKAPDGSYTTSAPRECGDAFNRFWCAPITNIHRTLLDYREQDELIKEQGPALQAMF